MSAYLLLKFVHVTLAIVAVGFNASYGVWLARAGQNPEQLPHVLRGIKVLDDRFANPSYLLLLVTGLAMVWVGDLDLGMFWLSAGLGLYLLLVVIGVAGYTPVLRRQIRALEEAGPESAEFRRLSKRGQVLGGILGVLVMVIVFLMVTKPTF
ncbi:MAG: DUF2269 domain-containing protein [Actinomycetota bacterium]|nr:DUF2269 domain-containing protein [Actinomycetota bacterium]